MIITHPHDKNGIIEGIYHGHWFHAVLNDEPSLFGVDGGRVSELIISQSAAVPTIATDQFCGYVFMNSRTLVFDAVYQGIKATLTRELESLPKVHSIPPTPDITKMVKSYINNSAFGGLYKEGCCCWGDGILECQKIIVADTSMCRAGYKHKSRLDGITIKPYPPDRKK